MTDMDKPSHVVRLAKGGCVCMSCGGEVDEDGMAYGGEVSDTPQAKELSEQEKKALFDKAVRKK